MNDRKVYLRSVIEGDSTMVHSWWTDGRVMEFVGYPDGLNVTVNDVLQDIKRYEASQSSEFLIVLDENKRGIGEFAYSKISDGTYSFDIKIGDFESQGKGYGRMALIEGLKTIKSQPDAKRIEISVAPENTRALSLYRSIGFKTVELIKNNWKDQLGNLRSTEVLEMNI